MRIPYPELLLTAVLAAGFAAVGELVLRRRARDLAEANEALLAGMGVCAAGLFPLTLLLSRRALLAEGLLIGAALVRAVGVRVRRRSAPDAARTGSKDPVARSILAAVAVVALGFAALNFRYTYLWDGFLIWATKAQLLFHAGGLTRVWFPNDLYDLRHLAYPPLVPLGEALLSLVRGNIDFDRFKPLFLLFYLSLLAGTYAAARSMLSARLAAVATLLVCLVPALTTQFAAGGFADMPQAAFVAGVVAAGLAGRTRSLPWLIGGLTTVKSEGTILAAIACGAVVFCGLLESRREILRRVAGAARGISIIGVFFLLRVAYVRWISAPELVYTGNARSALPRIPQTSKLCAAELLDPAQWGILWPAFGAAAFLLLARGSSRERALAAATAVGLVLAMVPFLFSNWPLELQISQAYSRLAAQLAPAAVVVVALGYAAARESPGRGAVLR